jgi:hypothetical protein
LQLPLLPKHQAQRNTARALVNLWGQVVAAYPEDAYAAAAMLICRNAHEEPWSSQDKLSLWFRALGGETYFADGKIHWANVVAYLIPEVSCQSCPIAQLPADKLRNDLGQGQSGPLGMPCRVGQRPTAVCTAWPRTTRSTSASPGVGATGPASSPRAAITASSGWKICRPPGRRSSRLRPRKTAGRPPPVLARLALVQPPPGLRPPVLTPPTLADGRL